ncbi:MAG: glycosyltransferase family 2 protein [Oscillospiraceae bacterium]|nr:glycosyltransferase family 2 protein [Oscillospiraceae bacterium]
MEILEFISKAVAAFLAVCYCYQFLYIPVALFAKIKKRRLPPSKKENNYAVLICARNEENVIHELIESIRQQSYPAEKITVFVAADNCTDGTAAAARSCGAVVYERFDMRLIGKGYAMEFLLDCIKQDYGDIFDGYFVFDADNILTYNYIEQMDRTFCSGYDIVTSYRNSKNYGDNWVSSGYGLWFIKSSVYLNQARHTLGVSCAVSGTGFMFSRRIIEKQNGWPYHLLTEDIEFSVANIAQGEKIGICADAVFYDEQPTSFRQAWQQRMRWAKGYLQVFWKYKSPLFKGCVRGSFSCFDMLMTTMPSFVLSLIIFASNIALAVMAVAKGENPFLTMTTLLQSLFGAYLSLFGLSVFTTVTEWKRILASPLKKILYCFTVPIFQATYIPVSLWALFVNVTWKPIHHSVSGRELLAKNKTAA